MKTIYLLQHTRVGCGMFEDVKVIGVFSSLQACEEVIEKLRLQPGFRDHPNGFSIDKLELDSFSWKEGFGTE